MMKQTIGLPHALLSCLLAALPAAHAATETPDQLMDFIPAADETSMTLVWYPPTDDFGPAPPCSLVAYTLTIYNDGTPVAPAFNQTNAPLSADSNGHCVFRKSIGPGAVYTSKISPGIWSATARKGSQPRISDQEVIYACTAKQGKTPVYWLWHASYTDHFLTTYASERNTAIGLGYANLGTGFALPAPVRFGSTPLYRTFKDAPQIEHFYTASQSDLQFVTQNGYTDEGVLGYVFASQKPGTHALHRFSRYDAATGDLQHLYSINRYDPHASGLTYEGVTGYVCAP